MSEFLIESELEDTRWNVTIPQINDVINNVKTAVEQYLFTQKDKILLQTSKPLLINVCLSNDEHVHELNKLFRNIDKSTNVLSFANIDFADFSIVNNPYDEIELGDIIIAYETTLSEAQELQISVQVHFCHLLVHGILHLCGYDHIDTKDAEIMENMEIEILQSLDIANPYA